MRALFLALLLLGALIPGLRAQTPLTTLSFTNFIANVAPAATSPCSSSDLIPVIQGGVTKHLSCAVSALSSGGSGGQITQLLQLAAGPNTGITIAGDLVLQEDLLHNLSVATSSTIQSILFGNSKVPIILWGPLTLGNGVPDPFSPSLAGPTKIAVYGPITMLAQTVMNGSVAMTNLPTSSGGQCLGYNTLTKQLYVSWLAKC